MTKFIDLMYCDCSNGAQILACAPTSAYISKGDIVCIDDMTGFYLVSRLITVAKDSDTYKFITDVLGTPSTVTDKYTHQEIGGIEDEQYY
jgi:hypothetical protein